MNTNKKAAFLIYVENEAEFEKFMQTINRQDAFYGLNFIGQTDNLKSNYIIVDLINGRATWGGNELRPFGIYTPTYRSINGGAMNVDYFIELCTLLSVSRIPSKKFIVPINDEIAKLIQNDGYTILHRPYFGMRDSTHTLYTIAPLSQTGVDAAEIGTENITQDDFLKLYRS